MEEGYKSMVEKERAEGREYLCGDKGEKEEKRGRERKRMIEKYKTKNNTPGEEKEEKKGFTSVDI